MKTKILALALILIIAAAAIVCVSCAKKEEKAELPTEMLSYTVLNSTGRNVTEVVVEDRKGSTKMVTKPQEGGWQDGESISFSMNVTVENNAPDLGFSFTVEGGNSLYGQVTRKDGVITLLDGENGLAFEVSEPAR